MIDFILFCSYGTLAGVWAFLFTGPLSDAGMVFGWLKKWAYTHLPEWLFLPLIGCAKCNAFWWALGICIYHMGVFPETIILAVFTAYKMQTHD